MTTRRQTRYHFNRKPRNWRRRRRLRSLTDPGRADGWTSERIWRWMTPAERARAALVGAYLNPHEPPLRSDGDHGECRCGKEGA